MMSSFASATVRSPSSEIESLTELMYVPSPSNAHGQAPVSSVGSMPCPANHEAGGIWMAGMGKPNLRANSKSRWSPQGTAMMAPVPYPINT
ncbi:unannotated protein [freshwater metagenome]|uniref:Unannotated protein n=1 Tax=freshwater metagenome TaxID=449393 RepID=A0A6J7EU08_9ZZZZ